MADVQRRTYELFFPRDFSYDSVLAFIRALHGLPKPKMFQPINSIAIEVYADVNGLKHFVSIPGHVIVGVESQLRTHIAGASLIKSDAERTFTHGVGISLTRHDKALNITSPESVTATMLSSFGTLKPDEALLLQWVITPTYHRKAETKDEAAKYGDALFNVTGRIAATNKALIHRVVASLKSTEAYGVHFQRSFERNTLEKIELRSTPHVWPMTLNAQELTPLLGIPFGNPFIAGRASGRARHAAPDNTLPSDGILIGSSNFPGYEDRRIAIDPKHLMTHVWCGGSTGTGKSTLMLNMAAQVMAQGQGLIVIEPKGDLASDVLNQVPASRINDVIWFDPTDTEKPIGLNVLTGDPEMVSGHIVGMIKRLYGDTSWGPRLEQILRYSVQTAAEAGLTLYDVKQLLLNHDFRRKTVRQMKDPDVRQFWARLDKIPDNSVDGVVNKLDAFVGYRAIRNIVGQRDGLSIQDVVEQGKILLVPLDIARMGENTASMFGGLLVNGIWQAIRTRESKQPIILMLDEFQHFAAQDDTDLGDTLAMARSYNLGMVMANQHTGQLPLSMLAAVRNNARTKFVFSISSEDAKKVQGEFDPLATEDLAGIGQYELAARIMTDTGLAPTVTLRTLPPPPETGYGMAARVASRQTYGRPRDEVEAEMAERHAPPETKRARIGYADE